MLSLQSKKHFSILNQIKYKFFQVFYKKDIGKFINLIKKGTIPRTHYALGLLMAAHQAKELGYKKISVIEFGCWNCEGLIDLENYIFDIQNFFNIEFKVYGFDLGDGHPSYNSDTRDRSYEMPKGLYPFEIKENLKSLKISKLILGDVKETIKDFLQNENINEAPIGFVSFDLGLYNSTKNALKLMNSSSNFFIPRTILYFDNNYFVLENEGDLLAKNEFNPQSQKKICDIGELSEQLSLFWRKWLFLGKRIKILSDHNHKKFNNFYEPKIMKMLNKDLPNK
jgi:hypothetical protein